MPCAQGCRGVGVTCRLVHRRLAWGLVGVISGPMGKGQKKPWWSPLLVVMPFALPAGKGASASGPRVDQIRPQVNTNGHRSHSHRSRFGPS
eukprot:8508587-Pyramimonas_sp.AAC.1